MGEGDEPLSSDDPLGAAIGRAGPDSVDGQLVRRRLMAEMFGRRVPGPQLGRFELRDRIGHGGMGVVYRAWDPQLERPVAVKVVDTAEVGDVLRARALREARSLAKLAHPNVITVFEAGLDGRRVWIAMELVEGTTLRRWLDQAPRPDATAILEQWIAVGRGLLAAHRVGLTHRDVKPSNVLIGDDGRARLIDFGLVHSRSAGAAGPTPDSSAARGSSERDGERNDSGKEYEFVGTYRYAAPEQRRGESVGTAADQYALCACIWESLTGRLPLAVPEGTTLPKALQATLRRGLSEDPADRFPSLAELLSALGEGTSPPRRGRLPWLTATGLFAALFAVGAARLLDPEELRPEPCVDDTTALDGTWDATRRVTLRDRFAVDAWPFAATTFATIEGGLDDWAAGWHAARRTACEAVRIHGTQTETQLELRLACLERRRRSLQITLDTWSGADEALELPVHAHALLERLPELSVCADAQRLAEAEPVPVSAQAAVLAGYDRLSRARALASAGALDRAAALVAAFEASNAQALGHEPLRLELQALPAQLEVERERIFVAVPRLVELAREAEARHLDVLAARLRVEAAAAAAGRWAGPQREQFLVDEAETAIRRLARPREPLRPPLRHAQAALLLQDGRFEDALAGFVEAQAQARALGDEVMVERERWYIAATLGRLGRYAEARASLQTGRDQAERRWGPGAPLVGSFEFDLAVLALETGAFEDARGHLERAETIARAVFGAQSYAVARVRFASAKLHMAEGELAAALALVEQALAVYLRELGADHEKLAELHEAQGVLRFFNDDLPGSVEAYRAALAIANATVGPDHPSLARLHSNLGESQAALEQPSLARESFARALEIYGRTLPEDHPELGLPLKGRGQVALELGHTAQAIEDLERALALQLSTGAEPLEIADIRFSLARALAADQGSRSSRAEELAGQARADFERLQLPRRARAVDAWLGR